jgi:hypothetical protein
MAKWEEGLTLSSWLLRTQESDRLHVQPEETNGAVASDIGSQHSSGTGITCIFQG